MRSPMSWGFIFLLNVALLAVPTDSHPSLVNHTYSSIDKSSFKNQNVSVSASPVHRLVDDGDLRHPEPDNPSLRPPSPPFMNRTHHANFTTAFRLLDDSEDMEDPDQFKLDCTAAEYFSPSVEVDCYYHQHWIYRGWDAIAHRDYFISMPPAGLSYSTKMSERWANHLIRMVTVETDRKIVALDWYEIKRNNWGRGIMVSFETLFMWTLREDASVTEKIKDAVREVMCGEFVDISFKDEPCYNAGWKESIWIGDDDHYTWDNGNEG